MVDNAQQYDVVALVKQIEGLRNQRNVAMDEAAVFSGELHSAKERISVLEQHLQKCQNAQSNSNNATEVNGTKEDVPEKAG